MRANSTGTFHRPVGQRTRRVNQVETMVPGRPAGGSREVPHPVLAETPVADRARPKRGSWRSNRGAQSGQRAF
jgi:hypothetical protein